MSSSFHQKERTRCTNYLSLTARSAISMAFVTIFPQAREETLPQPPLSFTRSYTPSSLAISAFKFSDIFDFFIFQRRKKTSFPPPPFINLLNRLQPTVIFCASEFVLLRKYLPQKCIIYHQKCDFMQIDYGFLRKNVVLLYKSKIREEFVCLKTALKILLKQIKNII